LKLKFNNCKVAYLGAQTQLSNLPAALQEAREMIDPRPAPANNTATSDPVQ